MIANNAKYNIDTLKWILPLLFFAGYYLTHIFSDTQSLRYFAYNSLAAVSCLVLLTQIQLFEQKSVAVWIALTLFVLVIFFRFYWLAIDASPVQRMLPWNPYHNMVADRNALQRAFELSVMAFSAFSLSAAASLILMRKQDKHLYVIDDVNNFSLYGLIAKRSLLVIGLLMVGLGYLSYRYHIGEMGAPSGEALPFRMKGVIFYARTVFIPLAIVLTIYLADRGGALLTSRLGILILGVHGVSDMLLRNSRSALLLVILLVAFLMLTGGIKFRRKEKVFFCVVTAVAFFLVPMMTEYRRGRVQFQLPFADAFVYAVNFGGNDWLMQTLTGFKFVLFRLPGIESLWNMLTLGAEPLNGLSIDVIRSKNGVAGYLSYVINPLKESDNTMMATGFVGWFYLVAGLPGILLGSICTGVLSVLGWQYLDRRYIESGPVAQVFFLWMLFMALTEGDIDSMAYMFLVGTLTLVTLEVGLRLLLRQAESKNADLTPG